jgi:hypothetical protein
MTEYDDKALARCAALGLHPKDSLMGDDHHTDAPATKEDQEIGDALAWFLGGLFIDKEIDPERPHKESYFYRGMTSIDVWTRVARALRVHGLKIADLNGETEPK